MESAHVKTVYNVNYISRFLNSNNQLRLSDPHITHKKHVDYVFWVVMSKGLLGSYQHFGGKNRHLFT